MDEVYLTKPVPAYAEQIAAYRREFLERGDSLDGSADLRNHPDIPEWLDWVEAMTREQTCPAGLVTASTFLCVRRADNRVVGMVQIRHALNDYLFRLGGHIGYSVRPDERRKGYAKAQLGMALVEAAKVGLDKVLITCNKSNEASRRAILAFGGVLENEIWDKDEREFTQRYWVELSCE